MRYGHVKLMSQSIVCNRIKCEKKEMLRVESMPSGDYWITCTLNWICVDHVSLSWTTVFQSTSIRGKTMARLQARDCVELSLWIVCIFYLNSGVFPLNSVFLFVSFILGLFSCLRNWKKIQWAWISRKSKRRYPVEYVYLFDSIQASRSQP